MTSEAFVYIVLPGETTFVTAGKFVLVTDRRGVVTGHFVYGRSYLARPNAVTVDPIELPLTEDTFTTTRLKGLFGALRDAGPDYWGRRVIEKHAGRAELGELDYLLNAPDDRAGALGYGLNKEPPAPARQFNRTMQLERMQALADSIIAEDELPANAIRDLSQVQDLLLIGTAMGGARPKAVVEDEGALWLAKFNRHDDRWNHARVEHAMLILAHECGLQAAHSRLVQIGNRDALLVRRFDREASGDGYRRTRMLSALTLLRSGDTHQDRDRWSYVLLAEELRRLCANPKVDAPELFRRMVFNALISNIDDHPRNHAVIAIGNDWKLSPAYDVTPTPLVSLEQRDLAMACGDRGRIAHIDNLLSQSERFLLSAEAARRIIEDMEAIVHQRWYEIARRVGVSEGDCASIATCFCYEGFRLQAKAEVR
jgi:serine/threonine-protein kinase HipA